MTIILITVTVRGFLHRRQMALGVNSSRSILNIKEYLKLYYNLVLMINFRDTLCGHARFSWILTQQVVAMHKIKTGLISFDWITRYLWPAFFENHFNGVGFTFLTGKSKKKIISIGTHTVMGVFNLYTGLFNRYNIF